MKLLLIQLAATVCINPMETVYSHGLNKNSNTSVRSVMLLALGLCIQEQILLVNRLFELSMFNESKKRMRVDLEFLNDTKDVLESVV